MVFPLFCVIFYAAALVGFVRSIYLVFFVNGKQLVSENRELRRSKPAKTLIILGSGGHTAEILRIVKKLDRSKYSPRTYVQAHTDKISFGKVGTVEETSRDFKVEQIYRSREVGQSYLTSVITTLRSVAESFPLVWREKPDVLLCNGPGTCIPPCLAVFILKALFLLNTKIIFIESFCRVKTFSVSGRLLYYLADNVIVQWAYLGGPNHRRSILVG